MVTAQRFTGIREHELVHFFESMAIASNFDCLVAVERKGLALVRMLVQYEEEHDDVNLGLNSINVISDHAYLELPPEYFEGRRILIFDDTVFLGRKLWQVVKNILTSGAEKVETACILASTKTIIRPDWVLYRDMPDEDYAKYREELLAYVSDSDFLALDSEHLLILKYTDKEINDFIDLLRPVGNLLWVPSAAETKSRQYITIPNPSFLHLESLSLQPGTRYDGIVCKLRIIVHNGYAWFIPIVYPTTPDSASKATCPMHKEAPGACICGEHGEGRTDASFHCQALYASGILLAKFFALMVALHGPSGFNPFDYKIKLFPLQAVFPNINMENLSAWLSRKIQEALKEPISVGMWAPDQFLALEDEAGIRVAAKEIMLILQEHADREEQNEQETFDNEELVYLPDAVMALPNSEIVTGDTELTRLNRSRALDSLIDQGIVSSLPILEVDDNTGELYWTRAMKIGGEYIRALIRKTL